jgi:hypothetical protein
MKGADPRPNAVRAPPRMVHADVLGEFMPMLWALTLNWPMSSHQMLRIFGLRVCGSTERDP